METQKKHFKFFKFYENWFTALEFLPDADTSKAVKALSKYVFYDSKEAYEQLPLAAKVAVSMMIEQADYDKNVYNSTVEKRSMAGKKHKGNQYSKDNSSELEQNGTNETGVPNLEQNGKNGTDVPTMEQSGTNNYNLNLNENKNFNSSNISEKAKILNEVTFYFFNNGCKRPYDEAVKAYEYNEGKKWASLKSKSSDSTIDKIEFLKGWLKNRQETPHNTLVKRDCMAYLLAIKALPDMLKDDDLMQLINGFSGLDNVGESTIKIKCSKNDAIKSLESLLRFSESNKAKFIEGIQSAGGQYKLCEDVEFKIQEYDI